MFNVPLKYILEEIHYVLKKNATLKKKMIYLYKMHFQRFYNLKLMNACLYDECI